MGGRDGRDLLTVIHYQSNCAAVVRFSSRSPLSLKRPSWAGTLTLDTHPNSLPRRAARYPTRVIAGRFLSCNDFHHNRIGLGPNIWWDKKKKKEGTWFLQLNSIDFGLVRRSTDVFILGTHHTCWMLQCCRPFVVSLPVRPVTLVVSTRICFFWYLSIVCLVLDWINSNF